MKLYLALIVAYTAAHIAFDRAYQQSEIIHRTPEILFCTFEPLITYGQLFPFRGFYEKGNCLQIKKPLQIAA